MNIWKTPSYMVDMPPWTPNDYVPEPVQVKRFRPECQGLPFPDAVMCNANPEAWKVILKFRELVGGLATSVGDR